MLRRCDLRDVFDGYALTGIGFDVVSVLRQFGQFNIPNKTVIYRYPLRSALAYAFRLENVDVVDQLLQQRSRQHLHIEESADRRYELLLPDLERVGFGEVFDLISCTRSNVALSMIGSWTSLKITQFS